MKIETEFIPSGSVTSPQGFCAGATYTGIKKETGALDLGILYSEAPCAVAAVFTTNRIKAAPVVLSQRRVQSGRAVAVVANSGCANACTGRQGLADAAEMVDSAAKSIGASSEEVLVASTGVIGVPLPMKLMREGMGKIILSRDGGHELARAIMTTDTSPKEIAITARADGGEFAIGGIAKGAGMIHPSLATMLCFLTTDAAVELDCLRMALKKAVGASFNMISVDGDNSPNDTVLIMANGQAKNEVIADNSQQAEAFQQALEQVCVYLAKRIAGDGEGASKLIEVTVDGAPSVEQARLAARAIVSSSLTKAAIHGGDPNWGRIIAALGSSGVEVVENRVAVSISDICLFRAGEPLPFDKEEAMAALDSDEVSIHLQLNLGTAVATAWGCDLSEEYVAINSQYTT